MDFRKTRTTGGTSLENSISWCFLMVYHEVLQEQYFHIFAGCHYLSIGSRLRTKLTKVIAAHASYPKGMQGQCVCHEMFI